MRCPKRKAPEQLNRVQEKLSTRDFLRFAVAALGSAAGGFAVGRSEVDQTHIQRLEIGESVIEVKFEPNVFDLSGDHLLQWVTNAARAVLAYYGTFPVRRMSVHIQSSDEQTGVFHGTTWGRTPPLTRIFVGRHTTQHQLDADWMMTHEMIHTAFPDVPDQHHWIEEGIASYVEPIARVQAGQLGAGKIWADMVDGMPKGEPQAGDTGLDHTHTWGRTYWGGALFCLTADVQIRLASQNRVGLQQALRAIRQAGGTIEADWSIEKAFAIGDKATESGILGRQYEAMKDKAVAIDLPSLWRNLGVQLAARGEVSFNDRAPWAATRLAVTAPVEPETL